MDFIRAARFALAMGIGYLPFSSCLSVSLQSAANAR